ncbi:RNA ligase/cyclic nucleotide phosphodiesterase [Chloropicon primus]|uniref:RNA ligase/cyclic nucleotide phosphodiesterase n=1 Tax=Chloropicon primus TaxID=1764295 RepID=A0A5B8MGN9_9CHLO|nr:RNA ligase/cyclic nucleotide phosphodiesterase [Chloropicon primus]UPQ97721.1 RNA ligase/cyclic nucleotide phosphodiesterase [Chloropicon primus]|eukprot:QDZ18512.1 RNA ligase/cyclic nucleotide phosphodiesterase [Chloropicon primus]
MTGETTTSPRTRTREGGKQQQYSLWITPQGRTGEGLGQIIGELAGKYETESFEPHVTLLSVFELQQEDLKSVEDSLSELARGTSPFEITLGSVVSGASFFQCVFLLCPVDGAPNADLVQLHQSVRKVLEGNEAVKVSLANPNYMPHLSLLYSGVQGEEKEGAKGQASAMLRERLPAEGGSSLSFGVRSFELYETPMGTGDNSTKSWRRVASFDLGG